MTIADIANELELHKHIKRSAVTVTPAAVEEAHERLERIRTFYKSLPRCGQCGQTYFERACGPTHAALAAPMMTPGEAQRQRRRFDDLAAAVRNALPVFQSLLASRKQVPPPDVACVLAPNAIASLEAALTRDETRYCAWCGKTGQATQGYPYCHYECEQSHHRNSEAR